MRGQQQEAAGEDSKPDGLSCLCGTVPCRRVLCCGDPLLLLRLVLRLCVLQAGAEFVAAADAYVRRFISRGIPSLFSDLKPLYADTTKAAALQELFEGYAAALRTTGSMPPLQQGASSSSHSSDNNNNRPPSSSSSSSNGPAAANGTSSSNGAGSSSGEDNPLTWVLHYLSQHYDGLGQTAKALQVREREKKGNPLTGCVLTHL